MKDIVVLHDNAQSKLAQRVVTQLENRGYSCWIYSRDAAAGVDRAQNLDDAIAQSKSVIIVFSAEANRSEQMMSDLDVLFNFEVPCIIYQANEVPQSFTTKYLYDTNYFVDGFRNTFDKSVDLLVDIIQEAQLGDVTEKRQTGSHASSGGTGGFSREVKYFIAALLIGVAAVVAYFVFFPDVNSRQQMLIGAWRMTDYQSNEIIHDTMKVSHRNMVENMKRAFKLTFNDDKTFERIGFVTNGERGNWELSQDEATIVLKVNDKSVGNINITSLTDNQLKFAVKDSVANVELTLTKSKQ